MLLDLHEGKTIAVGVVALLLLVAGTWTVSELLEPEQFEHAYVCDVTDELGVFLGGVSGTKYTGYPHAEDRTDYVRCKSGDVKGLWIKLDKYCDDNGLDPMTFMIQNQPSEPEPIVIDPVEPDPVEPVEPIQSGKWAPRWSCSPDGCTKIV